MAADWSIRSMSDAEVDEMANGEMLLPNVDRVTSQHYAISERTRRTLEGT